MSSKKNYNKIDLLLKGLTQILFFGPVRFVKRLIESIRMLKKVEKIILTFLALVFIALVGVKANKLYTDETKLVSGFGGKYTESIYGELKYLNPVLVSSDTDTAASSLIFSGLLKYDKDNNIIKDTADSWEVSPDKLKYTFTLKPNIYFSNNDPLTAEDVVYTVNMIKDPDLKSPRYEFWKDIIVTALGDNKVVFDLPKAYGPFIYNLDFGIIPSQMAADDFSKKLVGSGPFKYVSAKKEKEKIISISLEKNDKYYDGTPFIKNLELHFFDTKDAAVEEFRLGQSNALAGSSFEKEDSKNLSFATSKTLALIPNLRNERLKDKEFRKKILSDEVLPEALSITLVTADLPIQREKAEELKKQFKARNIDLVVKFYKPTELQEVLKSKNFELLLYGFDFGHDRDPYVLWHSSQVDKMNFSGYSDKKSDMFLEDARMTIDDKERNTKYDQFAETIKNEYLAIFYDPIKFNFVIDNEVMNVSPIKGNEASARYFDINKWYMKEKRVKK